MNNKKIAEILASQYKASLGMLRKTLEKVPEDQWNTDEYNNPNWQIAYHCIAAIQYYLGANDASFVPFEKAIRGAESLGGSQEWENPDAGVVLEGFHTKEELFSFIDELNENLLQRIEALPFEADSGYEWYPVSRFELHLNCIRHTQHHTAEIIERLKIKGISGFRWWVNEHEPKEWEE